MSGLDSLLAKSLTVTIRENLGDRTMQKIEQRIFERHGINLTKAVENFTILDGVLREFFGGGAEGLEKQFMKGLIALEQESCQEKEWITIEDSNLSTIILKSLGDDDKNKILNAVIGKSMIISDILFVTQIPQTSGYRKVNSLIEDGLLIAEGYDVLADGKRVTKYKTLFENVQINIVQNKITIKIKVSEMSLKNSSVIQVACSR
ncbi:MAG TPA: transcriptional regulator [Candidatus Bathyarchaeia archaeon]|nr:transcriptional regulator [Candidatus Bathyarchaeia archaeon]